MRKGTAGVSRGKVCGYIHRQAYMEKKLRIYLNVLLDVFCLKFFLKIQQLPFENRALGFQLHDLWEANENMPQKLQFLILG